MKRLLTIVGIAIVVLAICSAPVAAQESQGSLSEATPEISSLDKLQAEYEAKEIDYEQYLLSKYYAVVKPEKLPSHYQSTVSFAAIKCATPLVLEIRENWSELGPRTQEELDFAFRRPPDVNGGIDNQQHILPQLYTSPGGNFVVHWTNSTDGGLAIDAPSLADSDADGVPDYVENFADIFDNVWATEITNPLYGYNQPPSDAAEPNDANNRNPDDKYDVFIFDMVYYGYASAEQYPASPSCSFIAVDNDYAGFGGTQLGNMQVTAAHEFFHAIQYSYDCTEQTWWMETTAVWMEDQVYDAVNDYLQYLPPWFADPDVSLTSTQGTHEYGNCIFAKFLSEREGAGIIRDIWEEMASTDDLTAIDNVLRDSYGTNLETIFSDFAVANYLNGNNNHDGNLTNDEYEEGDLYNDVTLTADRTYSGTTINIPDTVSEWATDYIEFTSTVENGVEVEFQGEEILKVASSNYVVKIILYDATHPQGQVLDFVENHKGTEIIPKANEYSKIVLVIACTDHPLLGNGDYSVILRKPSYLDVVLDTDRSGSMSSGGKMAQAKSAATTFVNNLEPPSGWWIFATDRDKVGLVSFASSATLDRHLTSDFDDAKNVINGYSASGNTNMGDALSKSINEIKTNGREGAIRSIIYFTDGQTNTGLAKDQILHTLVPQAVDAGISIYTCGYGSDADAAFLQSVALAANGEYHFAPDAAKLKEIYVRLSHTVKGFKTAAEFGGTVAEGELKAAGTLTVVPGTAFIKVLLTWPGSDLDLILIDPSGNQVMPGGGVVYSGDDAIPEYYDIYNPAPGDWGVQVYGKDVSDTTEEYYIAAFLPGALMQVQPTSWEIDYPDNTTTSFTVSEVAAMVGLADVVFVASDLARVDSQALEARMALEAEAEERGETEALPNIVAESTDIIPADSFSFTPNNFAVSAGGSQLVEATLIVPPGTPVGDYSGTIEVTSSDGTAAIGVIVHITNQPPIADAGPDQTVVAIPPATTAMVTLDGSGSYDPDGDPLTCTWSWDGNSASGVNPTVELLLGTTTISLVVNDGKVDSEPDTLDVTVLLQATVDFDPDTLNLKAKGQYLTVYIELPPGFDVRQTDISSIRLNDTVPALAKPTEIADYDKDGIPDLMVKFSRAAVQAVVTVGEQVDVTVMGEVGGTAFEGSDTIRVISP